MPFLLPAAPAAAAVAEGATALAGAGAGAATFTAASTAATGAVGAFGSGAFGTLAAPSLFALPSLETLGRAAMIGGFGLSALGAARQGEAMAEGQKFAAAVQRQQAAQARLQGPSDEAAYRSATSRKLASRRALLAASGVEPGEGSPLMVSEDFAGEAELNALKLRANAGISATRLKQQAVLSRFEGTNARRSGYGRAGALILSGLGQTFGGPGRTITV